MLLRNGTLYTKNASAYRINREDTIRVMEIARQVYADLRVDLGSFTKDDKYQFLLEILKRVIASLTEEESIRFNLRSLRNSWALEMLCEIALRVYYRNYGLYTTHYERAYDVDWKKLVAECVDEIGQTSWCTVQCQIDEGCHRCNFAFMPKKYIRAWVAGCEPSPPTIAPYN